MLQARDLHKFYGEGKERVNAVNGVNLELQKGEILTIVGPSGSGKSTLLHLLGGLDKPSVGSVSLDGVDIYKISDKRRARIRSHKLGFIFQFYHLLPELTALENVLLPTMIKGHYGQRARERAGSLLEAVGLKSRLRHKPSELSGGEAQRVAVARSLINEPEIVLCDEPTGNLDSHMSKEVWSILRGLNKEKNQTFVIVTHDESFAQGTDRVLHLKDGALEKTRT